MAELTETERQLTARGDIAIIALRAILKALKPAQEVNHNTAVRLQEIQNRQPQGQQTLLSVVLQVVQQTDLTLTESVSLAENTLMELAAFCDENGFENTSESAEKNLFEALRQYSPAYTDKTDEQLRELLGL